MPRYDYWCKRCSVDCEITHGMTEHPFVRCPHCGESMSKAVSLCAFSVRNTSAIRGAVDRRKAEQDAKRELSETYGVERVVPMSGGTILDIHAGVKAQGSKVRDQMQSKSEADQRARKEKQKAWFEKANKQARARSLLTREMKAKEAAEKRAIKL